MKDLPYFLMLIKRNTLLWTIVTTNSLTNLNLQGVVHAFWSNQCLELRNYSLNKDEQFKSIRITSNDSYMMIDFFTDSNKYLKSESYYFNIDSIPKVQPEVLSNTRETNSSQKQLGKFDMGSDITAEVEIVNYGGKYGNVIGIKFKKKDQIR